MQSHHSRKAPAAMQITLKKETKEPALTATAPPVYGVMPVVFPQAAGVAVGAAGDGANVASDDA